MKKKLLLIISMIMLLAFFPVTIFAEEPETEPTEESLVGKYELVVNDEIKSNVFNVELLITENPGFISLRSELEFDENALKLVSVEDTGILRGWNDLAEKVSPYSFGWIDALTTENNTSTGKIVIFRFRVKSDIEPQDTTIKIKCLESNAADGLDFKDVTFGEVSKTVKLTEDAVKWNFSIYDLDATTCIIFGVIAVAVIAAVVILTVVLVKKKKKDQAGTESKDKK